MLATSSRLRAIAALTLLLGVHGLIPMSAYAQSNKSDPRHELAAFRQHKRVLLILAASQEDPTYRAQVKLWAGQQAGFAERDLVQLPVFGDLKERDALARDYGAKPEAFAVVLVGKDGHPAFTTDQPVGASEIFAKIDGMPMRREEMRHQRQTNQ